jgi:hypothetical protein
MITHENSAAPKNEAALKLRGIVLHDRGIALDPATGETFRLIGPALPLARLLQQGAQPAELLAHLLETYQVDEATAKRDLDAFLATLKEMRWVEAAS